MGRKFTRQIGFVDVRRAPRRRARRAPEKGAFFGGRTPVADTSGWRAGRQIADQRSTSGGSGHQGQNSQLTQILLQHYFFHAAFFHAVFSAAFSSKPAGPGGAVRAVCRTVARPLPRKESEQTARDGPPAIRPHRRQRGAGAVEGTGAGAVEGAGARAVEGAGAGAGALTGAEPEQAKALRAAAQ